jgi:hypothetical protein
MDLRTTHVPSSNKAVNSTNFAAGGIVSHRAQRNAVCRDKNKHWMTSYVMVYKAVSHVTLRRMRELSHAPTLVA